MGMVLSTVINRHEHHVHLEQHQHCEGGGCWEDDPKGSARKASTRKTSTRKTSARKDAARKGARKDPAGKDSARKNTTSLELTRHGKLVRRAIKMPDQRIADDAYPNAFVKAFLDLDEDVQKNILKKWDSFAPYTRSVRRYWIPTLHFLDPRPVLATLISDPSKEVSGLVVKTMPTEDANTLLYCTDRAFRRLTEKEFPKSLAKNDKIPVQAISERQPYYEAVTRFATLWRSHTPEGLSRSYTGEETFTYTVLTNGVTMTVQKEKLRSICDEVYDKAVIEYHDDRSYVGNFSSAFLTMDKMIQEDNNSFIEPLNIKESWVPMRTMNWGTKNLETVFGSALPFLQITMGFFAASLLTGDRIAM